MYVIVMIYGGTEETDPFLVYGGNNVKEAGFVHGIVYESKAEAESGLKESGLFADGDWSYMICKLEPQDGAEF